MTRPWAHNQGIPIEGDIFFRLSPSYNRRVGAPRLDTNADWMLKASCRCTPYVVLFTPYPYRYSLLRVDNGVYFHLLRLFCDLHFRVEANFHFERVLSFGRHPEKRTHLESRESFVSTTSEFPFRLLSVPILETVVRSFLRNSAENAGRTISM